MMVMMTVSYWLISLKSSPWSQNRLKKKSFRWKKTDKYVNNNTCTAVPLRKGTILRKLGYTFPCHLQRTNARIISIVRAPAKKKGTKKGKRERKRKGIQHAAMECVNGLVISGVLQPICHAKTRESNLSVGDVRN